MQNWPKNVLLLKVSCSSIYTANKMLKKIYKRESPIETKLLTESKIESLSDIAIWDTYHKSFVNPYAAA